MNTKNIITTVCGCGAAVFGALSQVPGLEPEKLAFVGIAAAFTAAFGYFAKDKDKN